MHNIPFGLFGVPWQEISNIDLFNRKVSSKDSRGKS